MARPHFLKPLLSRTSPSFALYNDRTGALVAAVLETAFDSAARRRGLLGRRALAESTALLIAPCNAVHTWFMRFSIDLVFVDRRGMVVKVVHALKPWRLSVAFRAFTVVELHAGAARRADVRRGDRLVLVRGSLAPSGSAPSRKVIVIGANEINLSRRAATFSCLRTEHLLRDRR